MDPQDVIDLGRQAVAITLLISAPLLLAGLIVGLLVALMQAVTQIQEQTVSFVPKLVATVVVLSLTLPWIIGHMVQYSCDLITNIPKTL